MHAIWFELLKKWILISQLVFRELLAFTPLNGEKVEEEVQKEKLILLLHFYNTNKNKWQQNAIIGIHTSSTAAY